MSTLVTDPPVVDRTARRRVALAFLAAAGSWVVYIVLIATLTADYEAALEDASEATDTAVNRLPAETLAQIAADHPSNYVTGLFLLLVPALLVVATRGASKVSGDRWGVRLAWLAAAVLWFYMVLNFGLLADPDSLPPLTRDLDVLTVPFVSVGSVLSIGAFVLSTMALRRHGWRPVACAIAAFIVVADLVLSSVLLVTSYFGEPIAPIALLPAELIVGIALLIGGRIGGRR
jgi:hypothetical protein